MKEHIEIITDSFVDYAGKTHYFVIAALSQNLPTRSGQLENNPVCEDNTPVIHEVGVYVQDFGTEEYIGEVTKVLRLGISICNPTDEFDEKVGAFKAVARARKATPTLFAKNRGVINTKVVKALLEQEAEYLKANPESFIEGYAEMKERYLTGKKMEAMKEEFSEIEKTVVEELHRDPHFLDNAYQYLDWLNNQEKGCQK